MSIDIAELLVSDELIELLVKGAVGDLVFAGTNMNDLLNDEQVQLLARRIQQRLYKVRNTYEMERRLLLRRDQAPDELYSYEGLAYFRPIGRGVLLGGVGGTDVADVVDEDGHYIITFKVHRRATNADMRAARED